MGCRAFCSRSRTKTTCSTRVCEAFAALCPEQYPLTFHRIAAMIARRVRHIAVALPRHEPLLSEAEIGVAVSCLRSTCVLRRENHGRAPCGHAALDGRRARRRSAAAQHARIRGLGVRAGAGSGAAEDRSAQIAEPAATAFLPLHDIDFRLSGPSAFHHRPRLRLSTTASPVSGSQTPGPHHFLTARA